MKAQARSPLLGPMLYVWMALSIVLILAVFGAAMFLLGRSRHVETLKVVAGALVTLVTTVLSAGLAFLFARLQIREQTELSVRSALEQRAFDLAFDMHREFCCAESLQARTDASRLLEQHPGQSFAQLYTSLPEAVSRPLFLVAQFYDRLALALQHERIDEALVPELFGCYFLWWWDDALRDRLVATDPTWPENARLVWLETWFREHSDPAQLALWIAARAPASQPNAATKVNPGSERERQGTQAADPQSPAG